MIIKFGTKRVAIESGLPKDDNYGIVRLTKLFKPNDASDDNRYDYCQLEFYNLESVDTLITALLHVKAVMQEHANE